MAGKKNEAWPRVGQLGVLGDLTSGPVPAWPHPRGQEGGGPVHSRIPPENIRRVLGQEAYDAVMGNTEPSAEQVRAARAAQAGGGQPARTRSCRDACEAEHEFARAGGGAGRRRGSVNQALKRFRQVDVFRSVRKVSTSARYGSPRWIELESPWDDSSRVVAHSEAGLV